MSVAPAALACDGVYGETVLLAMTHWSCIGARALTGRAARYWLTTQSVARTARGSGIIE